MAIANVALITFLALKNTPLAILTAYSYEQLNPLHQVGGYTTMIYSFLHALMQCVQWATKMHRSKQLLMVEQIHGITAASALLVMLIFAILIRGMRYEVFYLSHIFMYIVFIVNIAYHQPNIADKVVIITIASGAMWSVDRLLRAWRLFWYSYDNRATVIPLPQGGTRIVLRRAPTRSVPGNHCFVWIPEIRAFETHPFTIVSKSLNSIELVVAAYDGFTDDLHNFAVKHPGASLRASFDGPYGTVPIFSKSADKVIFIAGGSGASFTFGVALDMVRKLDNNLPKPKIEFIWTVREPGKLFGTPFIEIRLLT
jgi:predicted ferric reductase